MSLSRSKSGQVSLQSFSDSTDWCNLDGHQPLLIDHCRWGCPYLSRPTSGPQDPTRMMAMRRTRWMRRGKRRTGQRRSRMFKLMRRATKVCGNYFKGNRCELRSDCNINFYDIPASWRLLFPRYERKRKKYNYKFSGGLVEDFDLRKHSTSSFLSTGINFARRMSMKITGNRGEIEHNHHFEDYEDCEFFLKISLGAKYLPLKKS